MRRNVEGAIYYTYAMMSSDDKLRHLSMLHDTFHIYLSRRAFDVLTAMMNDWDESDDVNEIQTILIVSATFKKHPELQPAWERLLNIRDKLLATLKDEREAMTAAVEPAKMMKVHCPESLFKDYPNCPKKIPMDLLNEEQAKKNHNQSLDRLNGRGGLHPIEIVAIMKKVSYNGVESLTVGQAIQFINTAIKGGKNGKQNA